MQPFQRSRAASRRRKLDTLNFEWPIFENAAAWLLRQNILTPDAMRSMQAEASAEANAVTREYAKGLGDRLGSELRESFAKGEGFDAWQTRAAAFTSLAAHQAEAISRTYTHRAQQAGLDEVMKDEAVGELFPYLIYYATQDTRTRPTHRAMDGKVAHKDSPTAARMRELVSEWGCRCTLSPATLEDAQAQGIDDNTGADSPPSEKPQVEPTEQPSAPKPVYDANDPATWEKWTPPSATKQPTTADVQTAIQRAIADDHARGNIAGMTSIPQIREAVRQRLGDEAASPAMFDKALIEMRKDAFNVIPVSDPSKVADAKDAIPGLGNTLYYVEPKKPWLEKALDERPKITVAPKVAKSIEKAVESAVDELKGRAGMAPIHAVRDRIAAEFGLDAAHPDVLNAIINKLRREKGWRLIPISDRSRATTEQLRDAIPGLNETLFYIEPGR